ncbi:hypothetical protein CK218_29770 [Mesorhizobium sp. WSM3879]|nr:hypothetical protein CK218_29770 [Mesorhizobium sp. WSM3879]
MKLDARQKHVVLIDRVTCAEVDDCIRIVEKHLLHSIRLERFPVVETCTPAHCLDTPPLFPLVIADLVILSPAYEIERDIAQ